MCSTSVGQLFIFYLCLFMKKHSSYASSWVHVMLWIILEIERTFFTSHQINTSSIFFLRVTLSSTHMITPLHMCKKDNIKPFDLSPKLFFFFLSKETQLNLKEYSICKTTMETAVGKCNLNEWQWKATHVL